LARKVLVWTASDQRESHHHGDTLGHAQVGLPQPHGMLLDACSLTACSLTSRLRPLIAACGSLVSVGKPMAFNPKDADTRKPIPRQSFSILLTGQLSREGVIVLKIQRHVLLELAAMAA
jgi:hypothetical protein